MPTLIEEKFKFKVGDIAVVGRWDRVDVTPEGAVIIDYKSSEVQEQSAANKRTRESLQLHIYALAWHALHGELPARAELRFLETGLVGQASFSLKDLERTTQVIRDTASGIRAREFIATPEEFTCRWCAFQAICPFAFQAPLH